MLMEVTGEVLEAFNIDVQKAQIKPLTAGHINHTFLINVGGEKFILQKINTRVFKNPDAVMDNIFLVTDHIRSYLKAQGKNSERRVLNFLKTARGEKYFKTDGGDCFRVYRFIENSLSFEKAESRSQLQSCGEAFGEFLKMLTSLSPELLSETIPDFHNIPKRFEAFLESIRLDCKGRLCEVLQEVEYIKSFKDYVSVLEKAHAESRLPIRIVHNDSKMANILFDSDSGDAICVIDLDTVMPGYIVTDFGDSIRSGASDSAEGDNTSASFSVELFEAYLKGFLKGCGDFISRDEISLLPDGAIIMTFECAMRALKDYLDGDVYYNINYPTQNLDRARNQIALLKEMKKKETTMREIVERYM